MRNLPHPLFNPRLSRETKVRPEWRVAGTMTKKLKHVSEEEYFNLQHTGSVSFIYF